MCHNAKSSEILSLTILSRSPKNVTSACYRVLRDHSVDGCILSGSHDGACSTDRCSQHNDTRQFLFYSDPVDSRFHVFLLAHSEREAFAGSIGNTMFRQVEEQHIISFMMEQRQVSQECTSITTATMNTYDADI